MPDDTVVAEPVETTVTPIVQPKVEKPETEPIGPDGKPFDPERAMATIDKLRGFEKEAEKLRKQVEAFEQAEQKRTEAELSELDLLKKRLADAESKAAALEREGLQRKIAEEVGLPAALALRLQGDTAEEMKADAEALLESLPKAEKKPTSISTTNPGVNATTQETHEQKRSRIFGRDFDPFSESSIKAKGGGVFVPEE